MDFTATGSPFDLTVTGRRTYSADRAPIDFEGIAASADLPGMLAAEGIDVRNGKAFCPHHDNTNTPALSIFHHKGRWMFKCHGCDISGDAITWVALRDGIDKAAAARQIGGLDGASPPVRRPSPTVRVAKPAPAPAWQDPAWQAAANELVLRAEAGLWSPDGRDAREWLRSRKLADHTIRRFRLGYLPESASSDRLDVLADKDGPRPIWAPRGIVIPWLAPSSAYQADDGDEGPPTLWVGANVRRLAADPFDPLPGDMAKCLAFAGSTRGYAYPYPDVQASEGDIPAMIVEGELDALIGWQEAGWLARSITVGGSSQPPHPSALVALARSSTWLLALDHDGPGIEAARDWKRRGPHKARRVLLPSGKDLTEFAVGGGDVAEWVASEIARVSGSAEIAESPDRWRVEIANWPTARWEAWHRLVDRLRQGGATVQEIEVAELVAYDEIRNRGEDAR